VSSFILTPRQAQANALLQAGATHNLLYGGSRSGKTFLFLRAICIRALKAPGSRHAVLRFRVNALKSAIIYDTFPKVLALCWPHLSVTVNKSDWFAPFPNGSEVWFGGLDDKERTEKILGNEYATLFLNECSQIPWNSRNLAITRLAQRVVIGADGIAPSELPLRAYYDENPPDKGHWTYRLFHDHVDPESRQPLANPSDYAAMQMNPVDNAANLPAAYLDTLRALPARLQRRFLAGEFRDENPNALFAQENLDRWRVLDRELPDMVRVAIAVDPSGADSPDSEDADDIGIVAAGLGADGNGYLLEDLTLKAGPAAWGRMAATAYDRHAADYVVAERNFGGEMVRHVIQTARPQTPVRLVTASRGKVVRAEPIASLVEQGKVRLVGNFPELEDELAGFTTHGYVGERSPNRADAFVWAFASLFPGLTKADEEPPKPRAVERPRERLGSDGWMAA
jgi:hypothetical protein